MITLINASKSVPFHLDPTFWVAVCVLLFLALIIWKGAFKALGQALDDRAAKIEAELDEAKRLRNDAQAVLADYQRKQKEAEEQAEEIIKQARHDAETMAAKARKDMTERLERRAAMAEAKIASAEAQALAEVRAKAAEIAVEAAESLLRSNLKSADHTRIVTDGIAQMGKALN